MGVTFTLDKDKRSKWLQQIDCAISDEYLDGGSAQKLSGRLSWATQLLFHRVGRAMIKPIFAQQTTHNGHVGPRLLSALKWWWEVLAFDVCESREWSRPRDPPCHLFVDAASSPPRLAAVLVKDGEVSYTDCSPCNALMTQLADRRDKQITSLVCGVPLRTSVPGCCVLRWQEIMAIMMALSTFSADLTDRKVILFSDNRGAEATTAKGSAKAFDHNALVHEIWLHAMKYKIHLWVTRVPSKYNIADCPSRGRFVILNELQAQWRRPVLAELYLGKAF